MSEKPSQVTSKPPTAVTALSVIILLVGLLPVTLAYWNGRDDLLAAAAVSGVKVVVLLYAIMFSVGWLLRRWSSRRQQAAPK